MLKSLGECFSVTLFLVVLAIATLRIESFVAPRLLDITTSSSRARSGRDNHHNCRPLYATSDFWKRKPGESENEFFKRIQRVASDPVAFEKLALGQDNEKRNRSGSSNDISSARASAVEGGNNTTTAVGYQRAEDWDADVKKRQKKGEFTWEERVAFEGQRHGNQYNQNEILRKNLKAW